MDHLILMVASGGTDTTEGAPCRYDAAIQVPSSSAF